MSKANEKADHETREEVGPKAGATDRFVPPGSVERIGEDHRGHKSVFYDSEVAPGICYVWMDLLPDWEQKEIREETKAPTETETHEQRD
jgi:hypothetical protein